MSTAVKQKQNPGYILDFVYIFTRIEKLIFLFFSTSNFNNVEFVNRGRRHLTRHTVWTKNFYWNSSTKKSWHRSCQNLVASIWEILLKFLCWEIKMKKAIQNTCFLCHLWCFNFFLFLHLFCSFLIIITTHSGSPPQKKKPLPAKSVRRQWLHNIQEKMKK